MTRQELNRRATRLGDIGINVLKVWFAWFMIGIFLIKVLYPTTAPSVVALCIWLIPTAIGIIVNGLLEKKSFELFLAACDLPDDES